jgi:hypothetical protein
MLRYLTSTLTACALAGMISVFAQEQTPAPNQQEQGKAPAAAKLTGCVQEAKTTDGGTAYVLKAEGGTATLYLLTGPPPAELATHVNHKVEVTGQVHQPSAPPAEEAPNPKVLRPAVVQVESVKLVAESCN